MKQKITATTTLKLVDPKEEEFTISADNCHDFVGRYLLKDVLPIVPDFENSRGSYLVDKITGKKYLDCYSFFASNPIGFNHPKLNDPEFEKELLRAAKLKPCNSDLWSTEFAEFVYTFSKIAVPPKFKHLFFIEGGALAIENAIKASCDWKFKHSGKVEGAGQKIIHFKNAFHGRSGYTLSLTNTHDPRKTAIFPKFNWPRLTAPSKQGLNSKQASELEDQVLAALRSVMHKERDAVAAIIIEPIQGEGGDNHFRPRFHRMLRDICTQYNILLIYDEVQTGLGLTGKMWAYEHYGITPDVVCFGKKVQVCGIMCTDKIDEVKDNVFNEPSRLNSTWGGNLVDMVRSKKYLQIIEEEKLVDNAREVGNKLLHGLENLSRSFSSVIYNVRGKGLMVAFDLPSEDLRNQFKRFLFDNGVLLLSCGEQSIRLRPSLDFSYEDVNVLLKEIGKACVHFHIK